MPVLERRVDHAPMAFFGSVSCNSRGSVYPLYCFAGNDGNKYFKGEKVEKVACTDDSIDSDRAADDFRIGVYCAYKYERYQIYVR